MELRAFLFIIIFYLFPFVSDAQCTLEFSGIVTDQETRDILQGADITVKELGITIKTGKNGDFIFKGLCAGSYTIIITHVSCSPIEVHINIKENLHRDFEMPHAINQLSEVVVRGRAAISSVSNTAELNGQALESTRGLSIGESLKKISGITVLQTGNNIFKPVINGLHSNRVLILNNGIRQEGQQWGSEHAPEIDPFLASRITVIKGASSIRYGGDAIGGVILVEPKLLRYDSKGVYGELNSGFFSNNRQGVLSAMADGGIKGIKGFAWRLQGTLKKGGNAKTPNYWLSNSGNEEMNFSLTAGWKRNKTITELFYSFFNTRIGIFSGSHIGNVTDLLNVINNEEPLPYIKNTGFTFTIGRPFQHVQHQLFKVKSILNISDQNRVNIVFSLQNNDRREYDIVRTPRKTPQLELALMTSALDVAWDHYMKERLKGTVGLFGSYQNNRINYRYFIPNYQGYDAGAYLIEKYTKGNWIVEAGLRYDFKGIYGIHDNDPAPFDQYMGNAIQPGMLFGKRNYAGLSGNSGFKYNYKNWVFNLSYGSAWRNPQPNELFSDGLHHGAARIEKGQYQLRKERSHAISGGMEFDNGNLVLDGALFYKIIDNFIFLKPSYPPLLTIRGAFPVFVFDQTDVRMHGMDWTVSYTIFNHYKFTGKTSIIRAFDLKANEWLIQMPSDRFEMSGEYLFHDQKNFKKSYFKAEIQRISRQTRFPLSGNVEVKDAFGNIKMQSDYLNPPPGYTLLGVELGTNLEVNHRLLSFILSCNNLFNIKYRDYMNSFRYFSDEVGRNVVLRIKVPLEIQKDKHQ